MKRHAALVLAAAVFAVSAPCRAQIPLDLTCGNASERVWKTWSQWSAEGAPSPEHRQGFAAAVVASAFGLSPADMEKHVPEFFRWATWEVKSTWDMGLVSISHPPDHDEFTSLFTDTCSRHFAKKK